MVWQWHSGPQRYFSPQFFVVHSFQFNVHKAIILYAVHLVKIQYAADRHDVQTSTWRMWLKHHSVSMYIKCFCIQKLLSISLSCYPFVGLEIPKKKRTRVFSETLTFLTTCSSINIIVLHLLVLQDIKSALETIWFY